MDNDRIWFSVTIEAHNDLGEPFPGDWKYAAVRHHGEIVAYFSGYNGTAREAERAAWQYIDRKTQPKGA